MYQQLPENKMEDEITISRHLYKLFQKGVVCTNFDIYVFIPHVSKMSTLAHNQANNIVIKNALILNIIHNTHVYLIFVAQKLSYE
jgi:DNA-binding transcriptional ArsR family regulator